jgi:acetyl-CoA acetyltransferase
LHVVEDRTPVIVGIGLSDYPKVPDMTSLQHHVQASQRALADSGVAKSDIDGYVMAEQVIPDRQYLPALAEYLGIKYRYLDGTTTGGSSYVFHVQHAAAAIREGLCDTVLVTYGSNYLSGLGRTLGTRGFSDSQKVQEGLQYEAPYGNPVVGAYALVAQRHMHEYGTTPEQLAEIAVGVREYASMNPNAIYRKPMTVDDVLSSRMIADPLHLYDCCAITDGGGAFIMTTAERARDLRQPPVYVLGAANAQSHWMISQCPDYTSSGAAQAGPQAFAQAGVTPDDIDMAMFYDSFTITCLVLLEGLGFCKKGEGGAYVQEGHLRRGGKMPMNTDGGGLSSCHPGMRGIFLVIEAVRQLRGQAGDVQVPDCDLAVAAGSGGFLSCIGVAILGKDAP